MGQTTYHKLKIIKKGALFSVKNGRNERVGRLNLKLCNIFRHLSPFRDWESTELLCLNMTLQRRKPP